jgi:hypothetical protein
MKNTILLAIVALFLMTNCETAAENEQQQNEQQQQTEQTTEKGVVSVWKVHKEMTSGMGDETREGTITFYDDKTMRDQDGVVDISYNFEYYDEGATIQLANLEMAEDMLNFVIAEETETKQVWERLENDVQSVWTMTKQ